MIVKPQWVIENETTRSWGNLWKFQNVVRACFRRRAFRTIDELFEWYAETVPRSMLATSVLWYKEREKR